MTHGIFHAGFVFWPADSAWQDRGRIVLGEVTVGIVEDNLPFRRVLDHPGFQVVAHDPRHAAAESVEHRCVA